MSQTLKISDELYARLEAEAHRLGFESVPQLLKSWSSGGDEANRHRRAVEQADCLENGETIPEMGDVFSVAP